MALSASEKKEMEELQGQVGHLAGGGLSPDEQREMQSLQGEVGHLATPQTQYGPGQTALESFGNAASAGYLPQLQAGEESAVNGLVNVKDRAVDAIGLGKLASTDYQLKKQGFNLPDENSYVQNRDANIKRQSLEAEQNPKAALAGTVGGTVAGAIATPVPVPKLGFLGKGIIGSGLRGAIGGAEMGAIQNPGDKEGQVSPLQIEERADNTETGAKYGGLIGGGAAAGQKIGQSLAGAAAGTQKIAQTAAFKSSGAMLRDFRAAAPKGDVEKIGQFMLDNNLVEAGDSVKDVAEKAESLRSSAGEELDKIYKSVAGEGHADMPGFNPVQHKDEIIKAVKEKLGDAYDGKAAINSLSDYLDELGEKYGDKNLDPKTANDIKTALDKKINYSRNPLNKQPDVESAVSAARNVVNQHVLDSVEEIGKSSGDPELAQKLKDANAKYGMSKQVAQIAGDRVNRVNANLSAGLTDRIAGSAGGVAGGLIPAALGDHDSKDIGMGVVAGGLIGGLVNHNVTKYGSGMAWFPFLTEPQLQSGMRLLRLCPTHNLQRRSVHA